MKKTKSIDAIAESYTKEALSITSKKYKRTSFNLPEELICILSDTAKYFRSSKKDLVSTLLENEKGLEVLAKTLAESEELEKGEFNRYSIHLNVKAHSILDKVSKKYKVTKSEIVGNIIRVLKFNMDKKLKSHSKALSILKKFDKKHTAVDKELRDLLQKDDPILWIFGYTGVYLDNTIMAINDELDNDISIDESEYC